MYHISVTVLRSKEKLSSRYCFESVRRQQKPSLSRAHVLLHAAATADVDSTSYCKCFLCIVSCCVCMKIFIFTPWESLYPWQPCLYTKAVVRLPLR